MTAVEWQGDFIDERSDAELEAVEQAKTIKELRSEIARLRETVAIERVRRTELWVALDRMVARADEGDRLREKARRVLADSIPQWGPK